MTQIIEHYTQKSGDVSTGYIKLYIEQCFGVLVTVYKNKERYRAHSQRKYIRELSVCSISIILSLGPY